MDVLDSSVSFPFVDLLLLRVLYGFLKSTRGSDVVLLFGAASSLAGITDCCVSVGLGTTTVVGWWIFVVDTGGTFWL